MIKFFFLISALIVFSIPDKKNGFEGQNSSETGLVLDTLENSIQLLHNEAGLPTYYFSEVFTPVCGSSECLPIKINLRWDLDGNFHSYDMPDKEILTKTDHVPFTKADYAHLNRILNDSMSVLVKHTVYSLEHSYEGQKEVDGVSGATSMMTAGTYVPGALYTSVRLWHLVHKIKPQLKAYTRRNLLPQHKAKNLSVREDIPGSIIALSSWLKDQNKPEEALLELLPKMDPALATKTLVFLKSSEYNREQIAPGFFSHYKTDNEDLKLLIEELWKTNALTPDFLTRLVNESIHVSSYLNITIELLKENKNWTENLGHAMIDYCEKERNMNRRGRMKKVLLKHRDDYPRSVKKRLKNKGW